MSYSIELLLEGRKEDAYEKYVKNGNVPQGLFDGLVGTDPSGNQKYLMWMLDTLEKVGAGTEVRYYQNMIEDVTFFHNNIQSFKNKDINSYNWESFTETVGNKRAEIGEKQKLKQAKKESIKIYEDSELLILIPKSYEASCTYGGGTRWCTTMKDDDSYFKQYNRDGVLIYAIRKKTNTDDPLHKMAFYLPNESNRNIEIYNAPDNVISMDYLRDELGEEVWDSLRQPIMDYLNGVSNPRVDQFMTEDEIVSYLESGDIDILKFSENKLMEIFKTFEKVTEFVESKGLNPLYTLPPIFVINKMGLQTRDYLDHYNVNAFDFIEHTIDKLKLPNLITFLDAWWGDYDFDEVFEELLESKLKDFEQLFNLLENSSMGERRNIKEVYLYMFGSNKSLMYDYFNSYNKDVSLYMKPWDLGELLGDGTVNYVKDFDRFVPFTEELVAEGVHHGISGGLDLDTFIGYGYSSEDVKLLVEEAIISMPSIDLDTLRFMFHGDGEAGLNFFFDEVRMDMYLTDISGYSVPLIHLTHTLGGNTFEYIETKLKDLGSNVEMDWVKAETYDFTDEEELNSFIGESITDLELNEYYKEVGDVNQYLELMDKYDKELTQLMEIKIVHDVHTDMVEMDKETYNKFKTNVIGQITDLKVIGEDLFLINGDWCDFKSWISEYNENMFQHYFCDEDGDHEMFSDTIYDWENNIWENINVENMVIVRDYLKSHHEDEDVEYEDSDYENQTVTLTHTFIDGVSDSELGVIVRRSNELDELKSDLGSAWHWGYNQAYESEFSEKVMNDIYDYIGGSREDTKWGTITKKRYDGTEYMQEQLMFKVDFSVIIDNLNTLSDGILEWDGEGEFQYSDYTDLVGELINDYEELDSISVNMPDYPYDPEKHFNELIGDYI